MQPELALTQRLLQWNADPAAAAASFELTDLKTLALVAMARADVRKPLMTVLIQRVLDKPAESQGAFMLLVQLGCSNSGVDVLVKPALKEAIGPAVGVLVLGFAGANMGMLSLHASTYQNRFPSWRVVVTTRSGVTDARAKPIRLEQIRQADEALAGCDRVLAHVISNNGHALWVEFLRHAPALTRKVAGLVFDCVGPVHDYAEFPRASMHQVAKQTVLAAALAHDVKWWPTAHTVHAPSTARVHSSHCAPCARCRAVQMAASVARATPARARRAGRPVLRGLTRAAGRPHPPRAPRHVHLGRPGARARHAPVRARLPSLMISRMHAHV